MSLHRWLLLRILTEDRHDDVLGDGEEMDARRRARYGYSARGRLRARLESGIEGWLLVLAFTFERLRRLDWSPPGVSTPDLRLALRLIRKQPVLSMTAVLALATGIGAATFGFTIADTAVNGELPLDDGERYVRVEARSVPGDRSLPLDSLSLEGLRRGLGRSIDYPMFQELVARGPKSPQI